MKTKEARGLTDNPAKIPGRQPVFTEEEENRFVAHAIALSSFGFPITTFDLRCVVNAYLERTGRRVPVFREGNFPGKEWARSFMERHKQILSARMSKNITYARASTDREVIDMYFSNLEKELEGIPPENQWNYDETNLVDDPGSKKVITRRGAKYPEKIQNASKACTSIMVCGNAVGELAPIYVNYKSEKLWSTWTENGPMGARYNRTKSGWFDHRVFEDWFISLMLPILKKQDGTKAIIGDNLSSHLSLEVLRLCEENDIKFIALPPNSTHLLQPLDVAFFRPLKSHWRDVLTIWKKTTSGSRCMNVPKDEFPRLLKELIAALEPDAKNNLKSGFRKTGIFPLDKTKVLQRLPKAVLQESLGLMIDHVGEVFIEELNKRREEVTKIRATRRRKKLNVPPGKSIGFADVEEASTSKEATTSAGRENTQRKASKSSCKKSSPLEATDEETDNSSATFSLRDSDDSMEWFEEDSNESNADSAPLSVIPNNTSNVFELNGTSTTDSFKAGDFVVVNFENQLFPGKVTDVKDEGYMVSVMVRSKIYWKWPARPDEILYSTNEVLYSIDPPRPVGRRGLFDVTNID